MICSKNYSTLLWILGVYAVVLARCSTPSSSLQASSSSGAASVPETLAAPRPTGSELLTEIADINTADAYDISPTNFEDGSIVFHFPAGLEDRGVTVRVSDFGDIIVHTVTTERAKQLGLFPGLELVGFLEFPRASKGAWVHGLKDMLPEDILRTIVKHNDFGPRHTRLWASSRHFRSPSTDFYSVAQKINQLLATTNSPLVLVAKSHMMINYNIVGFCVRLLVPNSMNYACWSKTDRKAYALKVRGNSGSKDAIEGVYTSSDEASLKPLDSVSSFFNLLQGTHLGRIHSLKTPDSVFSSQYSIEALTRIKNKHTQLRREIKMRETILENSQKLQVSDAQVAQLLIEQEMYASAFTAFSATLTEGVMSLLSPWTTERLYFEAEIMIGYIFRFGPDNLDMNFVNWNLALPAAVGYQEPPAPGRRSLGLFVSEEGKTSILSLDAESANFLANDQMSVDEVRYHLATSGQLELW